MHNLNEILKYFPHNICSMLTEALDKNEKLAPNLQEIRLRSGRPIVLKLRNVDIVVQYNVTQTDILQTMEKLCENSIYTYKNQICNGFITIRGGHRIGITGSAVVENGKVINIKYITSLNFRIAREVINCSKRVLEQIINAKENTIYNTLIVSPPGMGKTTVLRDAVRQISNGIEKLNFVGLTCGVVDERGEIAAMYQGVAQNDIGIRTDVIENISKSEGMKMLIRSMAPDVIACDEIGSSDDVKAIRQAMTAGVKGIFTMHGKNMEDIKNNEEVYKLVETGQIEKIIFL